MLTYVLRLADDALILGHRLSEWTSKGPFLEEDIAMSNIALDYLGRARMYYQYAAQLATEDAGREVTEDDFAYLRSEREFENHLIHELPNGDFAVTIVRQFLVDQYHMLLLDQLRESKDESLKAIAAKAIKETVYHLRRSRDWMLRLGDGTEESHDRTQAAIEEIWGYTHEMFEQDEIEKRLISLGIAADAEIIRDEWSDSVSNVLKQATLDISSAEWAVRGGRDGYHTENLGHILAELQYVHRAYPDCSW